MDRTFDIDRIVRERAPAHVLENLRLGRLFPHLLMAATPLYAATPHNAEGSLTAGNANRDGTGAIVDVLVAGANGSKINEITVQATGQPADSTIVFYLYDGTTYFAFDDWDIGAPAAGSTTVSAYRQTRTYANLVLKSGWKLAASITVTPSSGVIRVHAFGGDF